MSFPPAWLRRETSALALLTAEKRFTHPWVGDPRLNRWGQHVARIGLSNVCAAARRLTCGGLSDATVRRVMADGIAVLPDLLAPETYARVREEARSRLEEVERRRPIESLGDRGFGPRHPFEGGFDRWDGGTLNRFVAVDESLPSTAALAKDLARLGGRAAGALRHPERVWLYETVFQETAGNRDPQKTLHRDTFHTSIKLWYFIDEVREADGPFEYAVGSHRMSRARLRWEHGEAIARSNPKAKVRGGAFRISEAALRRLGMPAPTRFPVAGNTLILADVRGFHRRGDGEPGARRLALHASLRPSPFVPVPY
ncbi:MAG: phytanoyl-CoA dioxygenase family protein [Sandaracinaceae bacterium]